MPPTGSVPSSRSGFAAASLAAPLPRLREDGERARQVDREELLLRLERARLLALLDERAVAAVPRDDLLAVLRNADDPRQLEQAQRVLERHRVERHRLEERCGARLLLRFLGQHLGDVGAVAAGAGDDRQPGLGVGAELAVAARLREQLLGALERQLVRGELLGNARPLAVPLEVRPVAADAQDDPVADLERVDLARVDRAEIRDELVQAPPVAVAEVEAAEPLDAMLVARPRSGRGRPPSGP